MVEYAVPDCRFTLRPGDRIRWTDSLALLGWREGTVTGFWSNGRMVCVTDTAGERRVVGDWIVCEVLG